MSEYGLDLSKWNGTLDFNAIKEAGHTFVILRAGRSTNYKDPMFEEYYKKAKAAGLKVGAYWYSYALTATEAEAKKCLEVIKGKTFEYPIFIDMEDADGYKKENGMPSSATLVKICETFCAYLEKKGYYVGVYASESWFNNQLKNLSKSYDRWVANWGSNNGKLNSDKSKSYNLHQFTSEYKLNSKRFDRNISYFDYATAIKKKGLNGFTATTNDVKEEKKEETKKETSKPTIDQAVADVKKGVYGNEPERTPALKKVGFTDAEIKTIQAKVNESYGVNTNKETQKTIKAGVTVTIKKNATDLNTKKKYSSWVYNSSFKVISVSGDRVVFGNSKGEVTGATSKSNVTVK